MKLTGARIPALDGVRGVAVLMVLSAHLGVTPWFNGGYVGVTVFFTLSGYLITTLLLREREQTGRLDLAAFYRRRLRRLAPAMVVCVALAVLVEFALFGLIRDGWLILTTLTYTANFEMMDLHFGQPTGLGITWSLAIEEQFYLLWPLVLIAAAKWSRRRMLPVLTVACVGSLLLRLWFADGTDAGWARGYFGLDTRADSILIGCALAFILHGRVATGSWRVKAAAFWTGTAALGVTSLLIVQGNRTDSGIWMPTVGALATAAVIYSIVTGGPTFLLDWRPTRWVGDRSYGMYLYQGPVLLLVQQELGYSQLAAVLFSLPLIVLIAHASYVLLERPIIERGRSGSEERGREVRARDVHGAPVLVVDPLLDVVASHKQ